MTEQEFEEHKKETQWQKELEERLKKEKTKKAFFEIISWSVIGFFCTWFFDSDINLFSKEGLMLLGASVFFGVAFSVAAELISYLSKERFSRYNYITREIDLSKQRNASRERKIEEEKLKQLLQNVQKEK